MTRLMLSRPNLSVLVCFVPTSIEKIVKQTRMALIKLKHDLMEYRIRSILRTVHLVVFFKISRKMLSKIASHLEHAERRRAAMALFTF